MRPQPDDDWFCQRCGKGYVVPSLARDCEAKHHQAASRGPMRLTVSVLGLQLLDLEVTTDQGDEDAATTEDEASSVWASAPEPALPCSTCPRS